MSATTAPPAIDIQKVLALPSVFAPNTMYLIQDPNDSSHMLMYLSSADGTTIRKMPSISDFEAMLATNPYMTTPSQDLFIVPNIAGLSALSLTEPAIAWVLDTTGDATANGYAAPYLFVPASGGVAAAWHNMYNANYNVNVSWAQIKNGPSATPTDIDLVTNWWMTYGMYYFNG